MARRRRIKPRCLGAIIQAYRASPEFEGLADNTKRIYLRALKHIGAGKPGNTLYEVDVQDIRRRHVIGMRDRHRDTPAMANQIVSAFSVILQYALELEHVEVNVARGVQKLRIGAHRRWSDLDIAYAIGNLPDRFRQAVVLALYTGQRQSDVLAMSWSDYDGEGITVRQQKTGTVLWIPCHPLLKIARDAWKQERQSTQIIVDSYGKPWSANSFSSHFSHAMKTIGLSGRTFHGLRMTAASLLAEAGCTTHEIAAITGHRSLQMLQHYTAEAEQRKRASAAIVKLSDHKSLKSKTRE